VYYGVTMENEAFSFLDSLDKEEFLLFLIDEIEYDLKERLWVWGKSIFSLYLEDRIEKRRIEIVLKLLREGKISLSLASKLARMSYDEVRELAVKNGIKLFEINKDDL